MRYQNLIPCKTIGAERGASLKIILLSVTSYAFLFFLTKIMGNRQMSQLSMFDYIVGISIGSIAAEMATSLDENYMEPLIAMVIYAALSVLLAFLSGKSVRVNEFLEGEPLVLLEDGVLYRHNFVKAKLDLYEFQMKCRVSGFFNLSDLHTIILEPNGKLSFIPKSAMRRIIASDLNLTPEQEQLVCNIIVDGVLLEENLRDAGMNEIWLKEQLGAQQIASIKEVFLATCDRDGNLSIYKKSMS